MMLKSSEISYLSQSVARPSSSSARTVLGVLRLPGCVTGTRTAVTAVTRPTVQPGLSAAST